MTTLRSGPAPVGTPQRMATSVLWWPQTGIGPATAPVDIPLLEDQCRSDTGDHGDHPAYGTRWFSLALLAQQGAKVVNLVVAEKSASVPRGEPSAGRNNRARRARSEAESSASPNRHLSKHDARWRITQSQNAWKYGRNRDDFRNIIEDRRRI
jgi:hypothetical protein